MSWELEQKNCWNKEKCVLAPFLSNYNNTYFVFIQETAPPAYYGQFSKQWLQNEQSSFIGAFVPWNCQGQEG